MAPERGEHLIMRIAALLFALTLVCPLLAQEAPAAPPNGSFEELDAATGLPAGWTPWNPGGNLAAYTLGAARTGVASASVTDDGPQASQGLRSPRVPVHAGTRYRATGYVWITHREAAGFAIYLEFWQGGERLANKAQGTEQAGEWVKLTVDDVAPPGATEATILIYASSATVGHAYFDDISLSQP